MHPVRGVVLDAMSRILPRSGQSVRIVSDRASWVLDELGLALCSTLKELGYDAKIGSPAWVVNKHVFFCDQFAIRSIDAIHASNPISFSYFHGIPGTGVKEFDDVYSHLVRNRDRIYGVQVTHEEMMKLAISAGIEPSRIHNIPIGIPDQGFFCEDASVRISVRRELGFRDSQVVIGSFQKDGTGWGDGDEPKLIKGPDVFVETVERLKAHCSVAVLLTGPARGYVKKRLSEAGVPYVHRYPQRPIEIARYYQALDVYLVSARAEGGPKAVLESMAAGIPIVSTRVGQAQELIQNEVNGFLCEVEDVKGLVASVLRAIEPGSGHEARKEAALCTARSATYSSLASRWRDFFSRPWQF